MSKKTISASKASNRLYGTLCKVLDALREEAPTSAAVYHPSPSNHDALIQSRSRALLHLFLKTRFGLTSFSKREIQVTDGSQDGGIDAYHIDTLNKKMYFLQSKFRATAGNFSSTNMGVNDLLKMDIARIIHGHKKDESGQPYNDRIKKMQAAIAKLPDGPSYEHRVVLLGNAEHFSPAVIKKLIGNYEVDQFPHTKIYKELLFPVVNGTYFTQPNLLIEINLENVNSEASLDYNVKTESVKANIKVLFVPTREVGRIMSTYKNSVLKFNPRSFLELKGNPVNQEIEASLRDGSGNEFAMFNNGITLISDKTGVSSNTAKYGRAQVSVMNPQLVNGGQTAYTLGRIYETCVGSGDFSVFKGKEVLLKIVTFVSGKTGADARRILIQDISKASNSQTKVEESDRRSNDQIQLDLQEAFFIEHGFFYERKRGEFADGVNDGYITESDVINREKLVKVALAASYRANQAKSGIAKFFNAQTFSNLLSLSDVKRYSFGYEVLRLLDIQKAAKGPKGDRWQEKLYGQSLRYGEWAVIAVCVNLGMKASKSAEESLKLVLGQWKTFEAWAANQNNASYVSGGLLAGDIYYKGATVNDDLQKFTFVV